MMKQKLALLLTALLLLTGCSSGGSGDTADGQDDGELETIDVVLDCIPTPSMLSSTRRRRRATLRRRACR